jgi:hypothetical protein
MPEWRQVPAITNSVLWDNLPGEIEGPVANVTYSDIKGGYPGTGDYHVTAASPCIDAGADAGVYYDIDGEGRPQFTGFDMGSDEYANWRTYIFHSRQMANPCHHLLHSVGPRTAALTMHLPWT